MSKVIHDVNRGTGNLSLTARIAGVVHTRSPILSRRMIRIFMS